MVELQAAKAIDVLREARARCCYLGANLLLQAPRSQRERRRQDEDETLTRLIWQGQP